MSESPSIRGLVDGNYGPLRKFRGIFDSMPAEKKTFGEGKIARQATQISFNFKDMEVIESIEPYAFPTYSVVVTRSNRKQSKYGFLALSLVAIVDQQYSAAQLDPTSPTYVHPSKRMDWKDCIGKRMGLVFCDGEDGRPEPPKQWDGRANDGKGGEVPSPSWSVFEVEGVGVAGGSKISPVEKAMELLNGRNVKDFGMQAAVNDIVRQDTQLLISIGMPESAANSFVAGMVASGKFTKDAQGVYHKV
jgi:hypothetical protein